MAFFDSFTDSLKQKWLQFFQLNRDWIVMHMEIDSVYTPDGGRRPPSYLILGVINALEPKLAQLMLPFSKLNPDADTLVEVLELNFDPDAALGNRVLPKVDTEKYGEELDAIDDETLTNSQSNGFGQEATANGLDIGEEFRAIQHGFGNSLSNESQQTHDSVKEFGELSFDDLKHVDSKTSATTPSDESEFAEVLSDVWGAENATQKGEADNEMFLGEEPGSFDDTEIADESELARLFPNT
ncbi:hypothetical protein BZZ01_17105 [Nostocales cyanobacterium HT-58-2]|nr:hypothetical protein BZZ01_17105 [Nostocales cyanobacterium HT-58-2]